mgnify:CR=1 FL=1
MPVGLGVADGEDVPVGDGLGVALGEVLGDTVGLDEGSTLMTIKFNVGAGEGGAIVG